MPISFIWPPLLVLVVLVPAGVWLYLVLERRRRRRLAAAYGGLGLAGSSAPRPRRWRRLVPPALLILGLLLMTVALARPQGTIAVPRLEGTLILAFDVSGSMAADDLKPSRMDAAKAATEAFVQRQPSSVVMGVVAFSDSGVAVQAPTKDQASVLSAVKRLTPQKGTSLGRGILASLDAIAVAQAGPNVDYYTNRSPAPAPTLAPVPAGSHTAATIVLVTDGENNESPDPLAAAQAAATAGVRIYTVGIGSAAGTTLDLNGFKVHTQLDEATLQQIAQLTGGTYFSASDAQQLASIYDHLDTQLVVKPEAIEVTAVLAGASLLLLVAGGLTSLLWLGRLP